MWHRQGRQRLAAALVAGAIGFLAPGAQAWAQNAAPTNQNQGENKKAPQRPTASGNQATPQRPTASGNQTTPQQVADEEAKKQAENAEAAGANAGTNAPNASGEAPNTLSGDERLLKMLAEEEAKYRLRLAKIQRIETIAKEKGDEALLARVGKVMAKLEAQHERKMAGMRQRFGERNVTAGLERLNKVRGGRGKSSANRGRGNAAAGGDKVLVCHVSEDGTRRTLEINRSALQAHLDHGDTLGPCEGDENVNDNSAADPGKGSNAGNRPEKPQRGAGGESRPGNQPDKNAGGGQGKGGGANRGGGNNQGGG